MAFLEIKLTLSRDYSQLSIISPLAAEIKPCQKIILKAPFTPVLYSFICTEQFTECPVILVVLIREPTSHFWKNLEVLEVTEIDTDGIPVVALTLESFHGRLIMIILDLFTAQNKN